MSVELQNKIKEFLEDVRHGPVGPVDARYFRHVERRAAELLREIKQQEERVNQ